MTEKRIETVDELEKEIQVEHERQVTHDQWNTRRFAWVAKYVRNLIIDAEKKANFRIWGLIEANPKYKSLTKTIEGFITELEKMKGK